ncbi:hypothetical protein BUPH_08345 (plasmid) [Paraburkholderia phenoliruptrix BR3459a]|uniref:Uncharacterized protein n=1 Tax=Paraburkholderia phenoliruptrix BR3459a TaxID=1229205 RepID=K0E2S1_9BURK|nr:hypothetical protein BUPH_08345 [Paraburkholderia phenoliruptrix BR3459a]
MVVARTVDPPPEPAECSTRVCRRSRTFAGHGVRGCRRRFTALRRAVLVDGRQEDETHIRTLLSKAMESHSRFRF